MTSDWPDAGWSPDGRIWLVDSVVEGQRRLRVFDPETLEEGIMSESLYLDGCFPSLTWSPDGQHLAYFTGSQDIESITVSDMPNGTSFTLATEDQLFWSPDGTFILIGDGPTGFRVLRSSDDSEVLVSERQARFSPDSRFIAFQDEERVVSLYQVSTGERISFERVANSLYWSPSGRYLIMAEHDEYGAVTQQFFYDTETKIFGRLALDFPLRFGPWMGDETLLLYADFQDYEAQTLLSYDMETDEIRTILETDGWIATVYPRGDWLAVRYSLLPPDPDDYLPSTDRLLIIHDDTRFELELLLASDYVMYSHAPNHAWSPDGRWFGVANDGISLFDTQTSELEELHNDGTYHQNLFWSPNSRYLVFETTARRYLWTVDSDALTALPPNIWKIIGWQYGGIQDSLLYCGEG